MKTRALRVFIAVLVFATMANTPIPAHDNPMMLGLNTHIQAHHHQPPHFSAAAPNQQQCWSRPMPEYTFVPVAPVAVPHDQSHQHQVKRERDGQHHEQPHALPMQQEEESYFVPVSDGISSPSHGKRRRPSNYRPPHQVDKTSVVAITGSLVGGSWEQNGTSVRMRRELSGSQLDQFFRNHDVMEVDDGCARGAELRPRSMSF